MILISVTLYAFACISAILDVLVLYINVAFNLILEGLGITPIKLPRWFDLVMGLDVTM